MSIGRLVLVLLASLLMLPAQGQDILGATSRTGQRPATTYERLLPIAQAGDAEVQNFLGFMFFYGDGVILDYVQAHTWFHRSAEQGNVNAQLNLGLLHGGSLPQVPATFHNLEEAAMWLQRAAQAGSQPGIAPQAAISKGGLDIGEKVYVTFCSGCHGMNGIATRAGVPSFALGDRLGKSDQDLSHSIINGLNNMPPWGATLSQELLDASLAYIRAAHRGVGAGQGDSGWRRRPLAEAPDLGAAAGAHDYRTFCAGCHGFNGVAFYVNAPSFALGESLEKRDDTLHRSISKGSGVMPGWEMMLSQAQITDIVKFIRTLNRAYRSGIDTDMGKRPPYYFRFRPLGERGEEWRGADPAPTPLRQ